jgi:hypothetical protein
MRKERKHYSAEEKVSYFCADCYPPLARLHRVDGCLHPTEGNLAGPV